ncbi:SNF2 family N-terminal domain-containing protein, partial [Ganoderma leucocontextum]
MLVEESDHLEALRDLPVNGQHRLVRLQRLLHLLRDTTGFDPKNKSGTNKNAEGKNTAKPSKKRSYNEEESWDDDGRRKRAKVSSGDLVNVGDDERLFPVYQRVFRLRYSTSPDVPNLHPLNYVDDERAADLGWINVEQTLREWLFAYATSKGDTDAIELGSVSVDPLGYCVYEAEDNAIWPLLYLPHTRDSFEPKDYDLFSGQRIRNLHNLLQAFQLVEYDGRARISSTLSVVLSPDHAPNEMPFFLRIQVDCSFVCPKIFAPVTPAGKAIAENTRVLEIQESQRLLILQLFAPATPVSDSYRGSADIPFLFSILGPAPALPSSDALDALQPEALLPTLLPFQRRSVGWMIGREGKIVAASGDIVASTEIHVDERPLPLFWHRHSVSPDETWYVNRLRGVISPTYPREEDDDCEEDARGGIVAEEPGLGKTLECISTIMLNPALDRSPINKRWDPEAKIDVKEIKTTLIVTPPSLAPQWADELAQHAPSLKVLIYEGWRKVPVPISDRDIAIEREKRKAAKLKPATKAANRKKAGHPPKASGKSKVKARAKDDEDAMEVDEESAPEEDEDEEILDWCAYVNTFDVCITTYNVLQQDLGVARAPPVRPRRAFVQYSSVNRSRSPLVMCEWYRVIMDEVQMVGGGRTEEMVSLIPRLSSFAVSGTPARSQVADLIHVLKFLRVRAVTDIPRTWSRLQLPGYVREFTELFRRYTVRHVLTMKKAVKDELTIPPQTRYLVPIELGRVERHFYDQALDAALLDLGLDARGVAATENWEVDVAKLRHWLRRLRGLCTHPQVGELAVHAVDKLHKPGVLKSMSEVLETMRGQNWRNSVEDRREKISGMATLAQLTQQDEDNRNRYRQALDLLVGAEQEADKLITDLQEALVEHAKEREKLKAELRASRRQGSAGAQSHTSKSDEGECDKDKGKERAHSETPQIDLDADEEGLPRNVIGEAHKAKSTYLHGRMREARIALHRIKFLQGDVYHVLGKSYEVSENEAYAAAEELRRLLLRGTEEAAERAMTYLDRDPTVKVLKEKDLYVKLPYLGKGGIKSWELMEEGNELIEGLLNEQSTLLWRWRQKLIALLTQPLGNSGEDADGQEYSRSLETQGEAEAHLQAYAALLADRRETLTAERTLLAAHDVREVKMRKTKAAFKAQSSKYASIKELEVLELDQLEDQEMLPEHLVMAKTLHDERKALLDDFDPGRAIKSILVDLNNVAVNSQKKDDPERILAQAGVAKLRSLIAEQGKLIDRLQNDLGHLRKAFNERIAYFRQLQEISDTVAEAEIETTLLDTMGELRRQQTQLDTKINAARARQRYMDNLSKSHEEGTMDEDDKTCILCKCDFIRGYITQCAHVYCEDCMKAWVVRPEGKACPVCRVPIHPDQLQRFSLDNPSEPAQAQAPAKILDTNEVVPHSRREIQYNFINAQTMQDVQSMEVYGSYGSKIETLVQHLFYIETTDPGAKSIVFSAWADSLLIIEHALRANGVTCLRIDQNTGRTNAAKKFRTDPNIRVLLLHGERENAGLNVTCASRVFLVESVVHHAFEVQAIARIDRMGQTRPTEVYCYYAEDSVERNILDLAAKQGLSLYTRDNAAGTLNITPFATDPDKNQVDAPSKKVQKGDFVYKTDDMLAIFFPHMYEDIEYLLPPEELVEQNGVDSRSSAVQNEAPRRSGRRVAQVNAIAGPS